MAFSHGSAGVTKVADSGATLRDFSAYVKSDGLQQSIDTVETTVHGLTAKTYIPGLTDGTFSLEGFFDPTIDGYLAGIRGLTTTFEYYPAGTPVGVTKPKYSGSCIMTSYKTTGDVGDATTFSAEFQVTGAVTRATA